MSKHPVFFQTISLNSKQLLFISILTVAPQSVLKSLLKFFFISDAKNKRIKSNIKASTVKLVFEAIYKSQSVISL